MIKNILVVVSLVLLLDLVSFGFWALSGQKPVDSFYLGAITASIIK